MRLSYLYEAKTKRKKGSQNPLKSSPDPAYKPEEVGGQDADAAGTSSKSCRMGVNKGANRGPFTGPVNYD